METVLPCKLGGRVFVVEKTQSCDKIPPAMSCITDNDNFTAICTNPAVIETTHISIT